MAGWRITSKLRHLTYANVVSSVCLFILLGGSAYAATKIGSKQIKDSSIQGKDIKNSTITGSDVKNKSLTKGDFKAGSLPAGPAGRSGATGATGPAGAAGAPAASLLTGRGTYRLASGTFFAAPVGVTASADNGADAVTTLSPAQTIVARDLYVRAGSGSVTVNLNVNGTDSALGCSVASGAANACANTASAVTIPPGSPIVLKIAYDSGSGGTNSPTPLQFGWRATTP